MRTSLVTALVVILGLAFSPSASGQAGKTTSNERAGAGDQSRTGAQMQTIRGVISGVTAEGETAFDFRANRATTVEAAYLTVIGSPKMDQGKAHDKDRDKGKTGDDSSGNDKSGSADRKRDNVYIVWLTPKTKVAEQSYGGPDGSLETVKDLNFDRVEVGDRVEIQFMPRDESQSGANTVQSDKSKAKHGRHRTFVGDANWITILPQKHDDHHGSSSKDASKGNDKGGSKGSDAGSSKK